MRFRGKRYITSNANAQLPPILQIKLWNLIEQAREEVELDYLQVFDLDFERQVNSEGILQTIEHKQEKPPYQKEFTILIPNPIKGRVFVIDNGSYITMMMAEDY